MLIPDHPMRRFLFLAVLVAMVPAVPARAGQQTRLSWTGPTKVKVGQTFNAHVTVEGPPTGTIDFEEKGEIIATGQISNGAADVQVPPRPAGTHTFVAAYAGDPVYDAAQSS